jgi:hypothetical protein
MEPATGASPLAAAPDPEPEAPEVADEPDAGGSYVVLASTDGTVWSVIGSSEGGNADEARRAYFEKDGAPEAVETTQYVAVNRRSFKPARPKMQPARYVWSPVA